MLADSFFTIGASHSVCQDYARNSFDSKAAWASLSDGCSSAPHSDIGARLLVLESNKDSGGISPISLISKCWSSAQEIGVTDPDTLHATLAKLSYKDGRFSVFFSGDGLLLLRMKESPNIWMVLHFESPSNCPAYLSYLLRDPPPRLTTIVTRYIFNGVTLEEFVERKSSGNILSDPFSTEFDDTIDLILAFSDGIDSFRKGDQKIQLVDILQHLLSFKVLTPSFLVRRMNAFLKVSRQLGWSHYDDLSAIAVYSP